jgi:hypothetical protein
VPVVASGVAAPSFASAAHRHGVARRRHDLPVRVEAEHERAGRERVELRELVGEPCSAGIDRLRARGEVLRQEIEDEATLGQRVVVVPVVGLDLAVERDAGEELLRVVLEVQLLERRRQEEGGEVALPRLGRLGDERVAKRLRLPSSSPARSASADRGRTPSRAAPVCHRTARARS